MISLGIRKGKSILMGGVIGFQRERQAVGGCWYAVRPSTQPLNKRFYMLTRARYCLDLDRSVNCLGINQAQLI